MIDDVPLLQIIDWDKTFEKTKSREVDKCSYLCVPAKQDSIGFQCVMGEEDGAAVYGVWIMLAQRCVRQPRPRQGWLTENGRRDGRRFTVSLLSHLFRRPPDEIRRMLYVTTEPDVQWIAVIEGSLAFFDEPGVPLFGRRDARTMPASGQRDARTMAASRQSARQPATKAPESADSEDVIPTTASELSPQGQRDACIKERNGKERKGEKENSLSPVECQQSQTTITGAEDVIQHTEAKHLFGELARIVWDRTIRPTQWPNDLEHYLDAVLPMSRERWRRIHWFYQLPADHEAFKHTMRRQSFEALLKNIDSEDDKIIDVRKKLGLNGRFGLEDEDAGPLPGWTDARRRAFVALGGDLQRIPERFEDLGSSVCHAIDQELELKGAGRSAAKENAA